MAALVILGERAEADGQAWHVPNAQPRITQGEILEVFAEEAGVEMRMTSIGAGMLRLIGLFSPPAKELVEMTIELFEDAPASGIFFSGKDTEQMIVRRKDAYDGALPSGNSVAMLNLIRLARILGDSSLEDKANRLASVFSGHLRSSPPRSLEPVFPRPPAGSGTLSLHLGLVAGMAGLLLSGWAWETEREWLSRKRSMPAG